MAPAGTSGSRRPAGPAAAPGVAAVPKTVAVPGAIGFVEGTGAGQPWLSATSAVQVLATGSALAQRVDPVAVGAERPRGPLGLEVGLEGLGDLLLAGSDERLLDLVGRVGERGRRRRRDLLHLDHVEARVALERADEVALGRGEDLLVERRLGLARDDALAQAAGRLGRVVDRVLLGDGLPGVVGVVLLQRGEGGVGVVLGLGEDRPGRRASPAA